mmetsp:Transcript_30676/g.61272  ORF Transcript_30676/g.61272 Transcript_30676/m.61272 type:complete len:197 (+) Transcript_30676:275-865(+)
MWRPGTSRPTTAIEQPQGINGDNPNDGRGGSAKKLSSATMGMRFMKRKAEVSAFAKKQEDARKAVLQAAARKNTLNENRNRYKSTETKVHERKRHNESISADASNEFIILEAASVVDMYGVGADVVGRRSFGGFHKAVRSTWEEALKMRTDDDTRTKATFKHITDEELLQRYEKYVTGRDGEKSKFGGKREKRKRD